MKNMKKILALVIAAFMLLGSVAALAQTVNGTANTENTGSITISNAAKGETYAIYKLFEATLGTGDAIAYKLPATGIPAGLAAYFEETYEGSGYVTATAAAKNGNEMSDGLKGALKTWAASATATASAESNGEPTLTFDQLELGYYVVTTTQGEQAVSVDSTTPSVTIQDKNTKIITGGKDVDDTTFSIGDTITYTGTFTTPNWVGDGEIKDKQVTKIKVSDTLPEFLENVQITSVKIMFGSTEKADLSDKYSTFGNNKYIMIPWAKYETDGTWTSLYPNGSTIEIVYTAVLTDVTNINAVDTNTISFQPYVDAPEGDDDDDDDDDDDGDDDDDDDGDDDDDDKPWHEPWSYDKEITTYAAALKKTDGTKTLAGAKFKFYGLTVEQTSAGVYTVVSYNKNAYNTAEGATQDETKLGTEMEVGTDGMLYVVGLKSGLTLHGVETVAPDGYNKLQGEVTMSPQVLSKEVFTASGTRYYDAKGNLVSEESNSKETKTVVRNLSDLDADAVEVVNNQGTELPSTGGMGTTLLYVGGSILVLAAVILLVTKRRMNAND